MSNSRAFLRYIWRSLVPLARTPGIIGWVRLGMSGAVALVTALGWAIPTDSPLLWITLVAIGLAVLFALSGFAIDQETNRPFPRIAIDPGSVTYDSASNQVWIRDLFITNQETRHGVALSLTFSAWTETPERTINHLYLSGGGKARGLPDPLNLGAQKGKRADLNFDVSGDVGEGPTGFTLTVLDRVTSKMVFIAPFPSSYPPSLRDKEKPRKVQRS
jgi:hypothetical protein